jgi:hypothetical protein
MEVPWQSDEGPATAPGLGSGLTVMILAVLAVPQVLVIV